MQGILSTYRRRHVGLLNQPIAQTKVVSISEVANEGSKVQTCSAEAHALERQ
jgi:hypothetical protein